MPKPDPQTTRLNAKIEIARRAFGDALSTRVNMNTRLGDVPVQIIREAMAEAIGAYERERWMECVKDAESHG